MKLMSVIIILLLLSGCTIPKENVNQTVSSTITSNESTVDESSTNSSISEMETFNDEIEILKNTDSNVLSVTAGTYIEGVHALFIHVPDEVKFLPYYEKRNTIFNVVKNTLGIFNKYYTPQIYPLIYVYSADGTELAANSSEDSNLVLLNDSNY